MKLRLGEGLPLLGGHEVAHLLLGYLDALIDISRLHALDDHLPPDLLPHRFVGLTVGPERLLELLHRHPRL